MEGPELVLHIKQASGAPLLEGELPEVWATRARQHPAHGGNGAQGCPHRLLLAPDHDLVLDGRVDAFGEHLPRS